MRKKISLSIALLAAAATFGGAAPAATAARHPVKPKPPAIVPAFSGTGIACSQSSPSWCIDMGGGGVGDPVKAFAYSGNLSQYLKEISPAPSLCNNNQVSDGAQGQGPPCPFTSGSHLNAALDGYGIVYLANPNDSGVYAAHSDGKVYQVTSGDGQLWVQVGDINSSSYGNWVNVYYSDLELNEEFLCENGNGNQLSLNFHGADSNCLWKERST